MSKYILCMSVIYVHLPTRRGHQIPLKTAGSHHEVAGNGTQNL